MSEKRWSIGRCRYTGGLGTKITGFIYDELYDYELWGIFICSRGIAVTRKFTAQRDAKQAGRKGCES